ncbi:MAG: cbb3-type cytochrome c oxidase subunit I, partial [Anaerolineales bacterium]|nr:cbb3-type cytochrome c oxidase subunit I [Anaerolineales bacterium]
MRNVLRLGLIRGIAGQVVGTLLGMALVAGIRSAAGMPADFEAALVIGAIIGVLTFLLACGVLNDWIRWIMGRKTPMRHGPPEHAPVWTRYFSVDYNHKVIGIQYGVTGVIVLLVGGLLAIIFRLELSYPGMQFLQLDTYNTLFSAHGIIMIASILLGVGAMVNYLVPLMIGASDMAFPRLNAFSYWVGVPAALLLIAGIFIGGWDTGWVAYPPHSTTTPNIGVSLFLLGFWINGFS